MYCVLLPFSLLQASIRYLIFTEKYISLLLMLLEFQTTRDSSLIFTEMVSVERTFYHYYSNERRILVPICSSVVSSYSYPSMFRFNAFFQAKINQFKNHWHRKTEERLAKGKVIMGMNMAELNFNDVCIIQKTFF